MIESPCFIYNQYIMIPKIDSHPNMSSQSADGQPEQTIQYDPRATPWGDITDPYNEDGQVAVEQHLISLGGVVTTAGLEQLREVGGGLQKARQLLTAELKQREVALGAKTEKSDQRKENGKQLINAILTRHGKGETKYRLTKLDNNGKYYFILISDRKTKLGAFAVEIEFSGDFNSICGQLDAYLSGQEHEKLRRGVKSGPARRSTKR